MPTTYKFNPGFQSDEESVQNFIVRKADLARALEPFREGATIPPRVAYAFIRAIVPGGIMRLLTRKLAHVTFKQPRKRLR